MIAKLYHVAIWLNFSKQCWSLSVLPSLLLAYVTFPFIMLGEYSVLTLLQPTERKLAELPFCCYKKGLPVFIAEA